MYNMKKNKGLKLFLLSLPIAIGGYFIYKQFAPKKPKKEDEVTPDKPPVVVVGENGFEKYMVNTMLSPLNVRSLASTLSSAILLNIPKGTIIFAKPSSTSGWSEFSKDGKVRYGYVSSQYLLKA